MFQFLLIGWGLVAATAGCGRSAGGSVRSAPDQVVLVVGEGVPPAAADRIERALAGPASGICPEPALRIERLPASRLNEAKSRRNVLLLANLAVPGGAALAAREALSSGDAGSAGVGAFFVRRDVWAPGQAVTVIPGGDAQAVLSIVEERSEKIRDTLIAVARELIGLDLYRDGEEKTTNGGLAERLGWSVRIPARGWTVDRSHEAEGLVRVTSSDHAQELLVAWSAPDSTRFSQEGAFGLADELAARTGLAGRVDRNATAAVSGTYLGRRALLVSGAWADGSARGPLDLVIFLDPGLARLFAIERCVVSSGEGQKLRQWELDALAATFRLVEKGHAPAG